MTKTAMDLSKLSEKHDQGDLLRSIAEAVLQMIIEFEREETDPVDRFQRRMMSMAWPAPAGTREDAIARPSETDITNARSTLAWAV